MVEILIGFLSLFTVANYKTKKLRFDNIMVILHRTGAKNGQKNYFKPSFKLDLLNWVFLYK